MLWFKYVTQTYLVKLSLGQRGENTDARTTPSSSVRALVRALVRAPGGTSVSHFQRPVE